MMCAVFYSTETCAVEESLQKDSAVVSPPSTSKQSLLVTPWPCEAVSYFDT